MKQAIDLYTSFREAKPTKLARIKVDIPRVVAQMGHVEAIDYRTTHKGKVTLYRHKFEKGSRPLLCVSGDGTQLMLLGGRYEWTDRGIQDADAAGNLIDNPKHGKAINPRQRKASSLGPAYGIIKEFYGLKRQPTTKEVADTINMLLRKHRQGYLDDFTEKLYHRLGVAGVIQSNPVRDPAHKKLLKGLARHFSMDERALRGNPKGRTPHHICPICGKAGGGLASDALRALGLAGDHAHPRCIAKAFGKTRGLTPARAHLHKGHYYFETHADAQEYAIAHGYPTNRINAFSRGWAIQGGVSGDYAGPHGLKVGNWRHSKGWKSAGKSIGVKVRDPAHRELLKDLATHFAKDEGEMKKRNPIETDAAGNMIATKEAIPYVQLAAVKGALRLESIGLKSRGGSLRKVWAVHLGLKPNTKYPELIAHIEKLMDAMLAKRAKDVRQNPKMRAPDQSDLNAAARGLGMAKMSPRELKELAEAQDRSMFAGEVIYLAAKQIATIKRQLGARD